MGGPATFKASVRGLDPAAIPGAPSGLERAHQLSTRTRPRRGPISRRSRGGSRSPSCRSHSTADARAAGALDDRIASGAATVERLSICPDRPAPSRRPAASASPASVRSISTSTAICNIAAVSVLTERVRAEGATRLNVAARGTLTAPELNGTVALADATLVSDEPNIAAENISAELDARRVAHHTDRLSARRQRRHARRVRHGDARRRHRQRHRPAVHDQGRRLRRAARPAQPVGLDDPHHAPRRRHSVSAARSRSTRPG